MRSYDYIAFSLIASLFIVFVAVGFAGDRITGMASARIDGSSRGIASALLITAGAALVALFHATYPDGHDKSKIKRAETEGMIPEHGKDVISAGRNKTDSAYQPATIGSGISSFIRESLIAGYDPKHIQESLLSTGWPEEIVSLKINENAHLFIQKKPKTKRRYYWF